MKKDFLKKILLVNCLLLTACSSSMKSTTEIAAEKEQRVKLAEINIQLGMGYLARKDIQRAKQKFLLAIDGAPSLPETWYAMGYFNEATGNNTAAKDYYLKAIAIEPTRGDSQNNYGTFLCHTGQYQEAITHFKLAVRDPGYLDAASAYENAGLCALKIPDKKQAVEYFELALSHDPERTISKSEIAKLKTTT